MEKNKNYSLEDIMEEYSDIIEEIKLSEYYSQDKAIATLIATAIEAGVNPREHDKILDLIERTWNRKLSNSKYNRASNSGLMAQIISEKPYYTEDNYFDSIDKETDEIYNEYRDINAPYESNKTK